MPYAARLGVLRLADQKIIRGKVSMPLLGKSKWGHFLLKREGLQVVMNRANVIGYRF